MLCQPLAGEIYKADILSYWDEVADLLGFSFKCEGIYIETKGIENYEC